MEFARAPRVPSAERLPDSTSRARIDELRGWYRYLRGEYARSKLELAPAADLNGELEEGHAGVARAAAHLWWDRRFDSIRDDPRVARVRWTVEASWKPEWA